MHSSASTGRVHTWPSPDQGPTTPHPTAPLLPLSTHQHQHHTTLQDTPAVGIPQGPSPPHRHRPFHPPAPPQACLYVRDCRGMWEAVPGAVEFISKMNNTLKAALELRKAVDDPRWPLDAALVERCIRGVGGWAGGWHCGVRWQPWEQRHSKAGAGSAQYGGAGCAQAACCMPSGWGCRQGGAPSALAQVVSTTSMGPPTCLSLPPQSTPAPQPTPHPPHTYTSYSQTHMLQGVFPNAGLSVLSMPTPCWAP